MNRIQLLSLAALVTLAAPVRAQILDDCVKFAPHVRYVDPNVKEVDARVEWTCDPKMLNTAEVKLYANGVAVDSGVLVPGSVTLLDGFVPNLNLPVQACLEVTGRDDDGNPTIAGDICERLDGLFENMPRPVHERIILEPSLTSRF